MIVCFHLNRASRIHRCCLKMVQSTVPEVDINRRSAHSCCIQHHDKYVPLITYKEHQLLHADLWAILEYFAVSTLWLTSIATISAVKDQEVSQLRPRLPGEKWH